MKFAHHLLHWRLLLVVVLVLGGAMTGGASVFAATGAATSAATPSNTTPNVGQQILTKGQGVSPAVDYTLTTAVTPVGGGTVTLTPPGGTYASGIIVSAKAAPASGYTFTSWSGGTCSGSGACSVTMDANKSVTANFTAISGSVTSAVTLDNATPTVGGQIVATIRINMGGISPSLTKLGSFSSTLAWDYTALTYVSAVPQGVFAGGVLNEDNVATGNLAFSAANASGASGNYVILVVTFNVVKAGTSTLNLEYSAMSAASSYTNLMPFLTTVTDGSVVANPAQYSLTTAVSPGAGGTINPPAGVHTYAPGTAVNVTVTPAAGYAFSSWGGACSGPGACAVTMDGDKSVTANFTVSVGVSIAASSGHVALSWTHLAAAVHHYAVYRSLTAPYFVPGVASRLTDVPAPSSTPSPVTFPDTDPVTGADLSVAGASYFYAVVPMTASDEPLGASNRTGAFVYGVVPGTGP